MNAVPRRRGWCPSLYEPMETGDGLLVRVHPPGARLLASAACALADAAARWGNGAIELTRRGNLQVRGLGPDGVGPFAAAMVAAGLADPDPARERRRVVIAPPLAGDDPGAGPMGLAERIEAALAGGPALASKFCIAVDAGGVLAGRTVPADILVQVEGSGDRLLGNGFDLACAWDRTVDQVLRLVGWADGKRLVSLSLRERVGVREAASWEAGLVGPAPSQEGAALAASLTPTLSRREREQEQTSIIGWHPYPGAANGALALGLPVGQLDAAALRVLAELSERFSEGALRTSPFRALLLGRVRAADVLAACRAAEAAGFVTDPADSRLLVTSCVGAPGCASATVPARQDAIRLANEGAGRLHVSGCAKGCAYPGAGPALVGAAGHYTLMPDWRPGLEPVSGLDATPGLEPNS